MSLHRHGYPNGISIEKGDFKRRPNTAHEQYHKWGTDVTKHPTEYSRQYQRPRYSVPENMNRYEIPSKDRPRSYPRSNHVTRPFPQRRHGLLDRFLGSLDNGFEQGYSKARKELRETAKDFNELIRRSPKSKSSRSEGIRYSNRNAEFHRQKDKRYSDQNPPRSKSSAHVVNPRSKVMLNNEKLGKKSPSRVQGGRRASEGRVFGFLFVNGNIGGGAEAKNRKDLRRDSDVARDKKEARHKVSKRTVRENKMNYERKTEEKRTRHHSAPRKSINSRRDHHDKAKRSHTKGSDGKERRNRTGASSRDMKTLCEIEISQKKGSGLVVKIRGKRS